MCTLAAATFASRQLPLLLIGHGGFLGGEKVKFQKKNQRNCCATNLSKSRQPLLKNQESSMLSLSFSSCVPLYESPGAASFDEYLEDQQRLFKAIFPGKCKKTNQDEWRVQMPPIELLFLKVWPIVDMQFKCKSKGEDYPLRIPSSITKILELDMTRWELKGLHSDYTPSNLALRAIGAIYSEQKGSQSWLNNQMTMSISFVGPYTLAYFPKDVIQGLMETVLKKVIDDMSKQLSNNLLEDYSKFQKEKKKNQVA